jgi:putative ABC transport system permease protein
MRDRLASGRMSRFRPKAPLVLLRHPAVFAAVAASALLVALAAASAPLFTTAAGSAALRSKLDEITPFGAGLEVRRDGPLTAAASQEDRALRATVAQLPFLDDPVVTIVTAPLTSRRAGSPPPEPVTVRLMARTGALEHVTRLAGRDGDGVWIADSVAEVLGIRPGDGLVLAAEGAQAPAVEVPVDGVYRALADETQGAYWTNLVGEIYPEDPDAPIPASFALASPEQVVALQRELGGGPVGRRWEYPIERRGMTLDEAKTLDRRFEALEASLRTGRSEVWRELGCRGAEAAGQAECTLTSSLSAAITLADENIDAVSPPARLLATAGMLVALAAAAAAGVFLVVRRRVEARLLFAQGRAPAWFAGRTALESLAPMLLGTAAGLGLALLLVGAFESRGAIDRDGLRAAGIAAALGFAAALALLALVAGVSFARQFDSGRKGGASLGWIPWEIVPLGLAAYFFLDLRAGDGLVAGGSSGIAHPTVAVFLLPLLVTAGVAGLAGRLMRALLRRLGRRERAMSPPVYLAVRRLAVSRGLAILLLCGCAVALGAFFYAQTLVATLDRSVEAKALVAKGGDAEGTIDYTDRLPERFPFPLTKATIRYAGASVGGPVGPKVDLMAIDPATIARVVSWEPGWGPPLEQLVARLRGASEPGMPVIVAGGSVAARPLYVGGAVVPVRHVAHVEAFPGMGSSRPLVVTSYEALERAASAAGGGNPLRQPSASTLVWGKGPPAEVAEALRTSVLGPYYIQTTETFLADSDVAAETRTFSYLRALGIVAGLLAVVGLVLYLQARQRRTVVAAALSRRMGLGQASQALALSLELGAILLVATLVAAATSITAARFVATKVDPLATFPPGPLFEAPFHLVWIAVPVLLAVAALGGALASRTAARADFAEVMRLGE